MNKQKRWLVASLAAFALGAAIFFFIKPEQQVITLSEAERAARQKTLGVFAQPAPVPTEKAQPTEPAATAAAVDGSTLLLLGALLLAVAAAAGIFYKIYKEKLYLKPGSGDADDPVGRLQDLACKIESWTLNDDRKVLARLNREAKKIGQELYRQGGVRRMLEVHELAGRRRVIESAWDGVGPWRG